MCLAKYLHKAQLISNDAPLLYEPTMAKRGPSKD